MEYIKTHSNQPLYTTNTHYINGSVVPPSNNNLTKEKLNMNRKKKINDTLNKKLKKANAKLHTSNKPRYISKAERAKLEQQKTTETQEVS